MLTRDTFLLFHALVEVFAAVISAGVFMIAWDTRAFARSSFFLVVGPAFALVGLADLLHMLSYKGMGTNAFASADPATQLWVAARATEVVAVLAGVLLAARPVAPAVPMLAALTAGTVLLASIFAWKVFPTCYVDGVGLTRFKIAAEYGFVLVKLATGAALWHRRRHFDPEVTHWLGIYLGLSSLSELAFTGYVGVYDGMNQVGHVLKVAAYLVIYWATSKAVLQRPYSTLFGDLETARQALQDKIGERTRTLAEVNDLLTTMIDSSPMGIFANDLEGRVILWNAGAERIYGWSAEEALGYPLRTAPPDRRGEQVRLLSEVMAGKPSLGIELERWRKDGTTVVVRDYAAPLRAADGTIRGVVSLVLDITAERAAERAARQGEDRLRGLMANLPDTILTVSEDGLIESASDAAERLFGYKAEDLVGQPVALLMPAATGQGHDLAMVSHAQTGQGRIIGRGPRELMAVRKDGNEVPVELALNEMWVDGRRLYVGVLRDISERLRERGQKAAMERELLRAQKMDALGSLAGGIAHEVNNMLTPILGLSEVALLRLPPGSPVRGNIEKVVEAASRARDILRKLLAFSRADTAPPVPLPLRSLVEETLPLVRAALPRDIQLTCRLPETELVARCAHTEFQQVMMNLCSNAGQAVGSQGRIEIALHSQHLDEDRALGLGLAAGECAVLTVSDDGIGMDGATAEKAFEPFFTTKPVGEGTGLGLSVVHAIVAAWGGAISVRSAPSAGTSMQVILPLEPATAEAGEREYAG